MSVHPAGHRPTLIDRIVAIDMLTVVSISLMVLYAHLTGRYVYLDVALVYGLLELPGGAGNGPLSRKGAADDAGPARPHRVRRHHRQRRAGRVFSARLAAMVSAGLASLFAAVSFLLLAAPDVAMAEAAIGSGLTAFDLSLRHPRAPAMERTEPWPS